MSKLSPLPIIAVLVAACTPTPPACQTAAGLFARSHHMHPVSILCAPERGGEASCTLAYAVPGSPEVADVVSLLCTGSGCECVGGCR